MKTSAVFGQVCKERDLTWPEWLEKHTGCVLQILTGWKNRGEGMVA